VIAWFLKGKIVEFNDFKLSKVVLEFRYNDGFLYWDNCGATILEIRKNFPEWKWEGTSTELSIFREVKNKIELLFNINYIRYTQDEVDNLNQLKKAATEITPIILNHLKIATFSRVGNRFYYHFRTENVEEGKKIIEEAKLIEIPDKKMELFGNDSKKISFVLYIEDINKQYRFELTTIERKERPGIERINEKFFPKYGLRADIDFAIINEVNALDFSYNDFIQHNFKFLENNLVKLIKK